MKKILFAMMTLTVLFTGAANAQNRRAGGPQKEITAEQLAERRADRLTEQLSLDAGQRTQLYNLFLESARENIKHRQQMQQTHEDHAAAMKAARENESAQLKKILTPEQYARWEQMQADRAGKFAGPKRDAPHKKGGPAPEGCSKKKGSCPCAGKNKDKKK